MTTPSQVSHILIGTAGHIDHGKTRLVMRLTGTDTDRLPEEKLRGISIDLGFAHWESDGYQFGVVDVPGHERFVKNMVAGAAGVNLALLVVAADDSVMPQTREHLEIMQLLGLTAGVVAITKTDLIDADFLTLVDADIQDFVAGTFLEGCPIVPVSSETGAGIEELKTTLVRVAQTINRPEDMELFRMPIDRSLSIPGHGTIVTGSVLSGTVHSGETLDLLPNGRSVRVRSVQNHGVQTEDSGSQQRTAINLAGVKQGEVVRGMELATPDYLRATERMIVELRVLASSPISLKNRMELSLHLGTKEAVARVLLKGKPLAPASRAFAELRLKEPVVAVYGQRFILRRVSPALTVAGGVVLDPQVPPRKRIKNLAAHAERLNHPSERERLSVFLQQQDTVIDASREAAWRVGVPPARYCALVDELKSDGILVTIGRQDRPLLIHRERLEQLAASIMKTIRQELERQQPRRSLPKNTLLTACRDITTPQVLDAVFDHLLVTRRLVPVGTSLGPADAQVNLSKNQIVTRNKLLDEITASGLTPPTTKQLATTYEQKREQIETLLNLSVEDGLLIALADGLYVTPNALEQGRVICEQLLDNIGEATMSQLREAWKVSRKFSVPLCEHFDKIGVTIRKGDVRIPGPKIHESVE